MGDDDEEREWEEIKQTTLERLLSDPELIAEMKRKGLYSEPTKINWPEKKEPS